MESLRVTARLTSAVAGGTDLPLDGILAAAWMRREHPEIYWATTPIGTIPPEDFIEPELPLERRGLDYGDLWYWAASFAAWPEATAEELQYWNKRMDQGELSRVDLGKRGKLDIGAGRYKAYHMPVPTRTALSVSWWVRGDAEAVRSLLSTVTSFGKKRSQGYGQVREWIVEPGEDWSCERDGLPTRTMPVESTIIKRNGQRLDTGLRTYRPPYWMRSRQAVCVLADRSALIYRNGT